MVNAKEKNKAILDGVAHLDIWVTPKAQRSAWMFKDN
jgi:hypothetical protein